MIVTTSSQLAASPDASSSAGLFNPAAAGGRAYIRSTGPSRRRLCTPPPQSAMNLPPTPSVLPPQEHGVFGCAGINLANHLVDTPQTLGGGFRIRLLVIAVSWGLAASSIAMLPCSRPLLRLSTGPSTCATDLRPHLSGSATRTRWRESYRAALAVPSILRLRRVAYRPAFGGAKRLQATRYCGIVLSGT
jgi:hypothetical protein